MAWPPSPGELLPRADEAVGVREKLLGYSLDVAHKSGGPKARGFERILGITLADVDYLEMTIREGILDTPIRSARPGRLHGVNCLVEMPVRGVRDRSWCTTIMRTAWELSNAEAAPRLVTAYLRP